MSVYEMHLEEFIETDKFSVLCSCAAVSVKWNVLKKFIENSKT